MRRALVTTLLLLPLAAAAQVYIWKDADGKAHYSDRPPADKAGQVRKLGPQFNPEEETAAARKAAADKRLDAAKRDKTAEEAAAKAAQDKTASAERQKNCERARVNLQGLESGQTRFRLNAAGEREALDGEVRDAELAEARRAVDSFCTPQPSSAPAAPPGSPKPAPGY